MPQVEQLYTYRLKKKRKVKHTHTNDVRMNDTCTLEVDVTVIQTDKMHNRQKTEFNQAINHH